MRRAARRRTKRRLPHVDCGPFRARAVFLFGFAKNDRDNVSEDELAELRVTARSWLAAGKALIERALEDGALIEVEYDGSNQNG